MALKRSNQAEKIREEVAADLTPMIDVTFQLLIFFMLTIKFKTFDGKLATILPLSQGLSPKETKVEPPDLVFVLRVPVEDRGLAAEKRRVEVRVLGRNAGFGMLAPEAPADGAWPTGTSVTTLSTLRAYATAIRAAADPGGNGPSPVKVKLDAAPEVPSVFVVALLDLCVELEFTDISYTGIPTGLVKGLENGSISNR